MLQGFVQVLQSCLSAGGNTKSSLGCGTPAIEDMETLSVKAKTHGLLCDAARVCAGNTPLSVCTRYCDTQGFADLHAALHDQHCTVELEKCCLISAAGQAHEHKAGRQQARRYEATCLDKVQACSSGQTKNCLCQTEAHTQERECICLICALP